MHLTAVYFEKCSITREEYYYSCTEIDHPTLLECGTVDRAQRFKQQQKTACLLKKRHVYYFGNFYVLP